MAHNPAPHRLPWVMKVAPPHGVAENGGHRLFETTVVACEFQEANDDPVSLLRGGDGVDECVPVERHLLGVGCTCTSKRIVCLGISHVDNIA